MEIIAQKKKSMVVLYAVIAVISAALCVLGIIFINVWRDINSDNQFKLILIIILGAAGTGVGVYHSCHIGFSVDKITYDGEMIDFGKGLVESPSKIVYVRSHNSYFTQRTDAIGSLTVKVGDVVMHYPCIGRAGDAEKRLTDLAYLDRKREAEESVPTESEN